MFLITGRVTLDKPCFSREVTQYRGPERTEGASKILKKFTENYRRSSYFAENSDKTFTPFSENIPGFPDPGIVASKP